MIFVRRFSSELFNANRCFSSENMERIDCGFSQSAVFKSDDFSNSNGRYNFTITSSSCQPSFPLQIFVGENYINPKINSSSTAGQMEKNAETMFKKDFHKFVERERRRDIRTLFSSLRSILPEEYITGKCSTEEQLSQSTNYINHLHKKIKELTQTRDEMRKEKLFRDLSFSVPSETFPIVKVNSDGWGVFISANTFKGEIVLSDLLLTLGNNGLDISSAVTCARNEKVFHTIHAKVSDLRSFDIRALYQNIWTLVCEKTSYAKSLHM
ncbi:transcription factor bHLH118-like isoform X1 [Cryptomeria japonica]|uniref:transcription factor bHLH118-like isoform X1 n=2 Tax=Cryptomeria japonica TaxID=3369 RepID=UPI0027DAA5FA|nr:transcription factor bHLH118-like isoform X1 [Cryptomeria japonica]